MSLLPEKLLRIGGFFIFMALIGGSSCVGPAEFAAGLPKTNQAASDERLFGWWYAVDRGSEMVPAMLLGIILSEENQPWFFLEYTMLTILQSCYMGSVIPHRIGGELYYEIALRADSDEDDKQQEMCDFYYLEGITPGRIIAKAQVDASDRLYLRFISNDVLLNMHERGQVRAAVMETPEGSNVERYLLTDIEGEELSELIRDTPDDILFAEPIGPFFRFNTAVTPIEKLGNFSGGLSKSPVSD